MDILNMAQRTQAAPEAPKPKAPFFLTEYTPALRAAILASPYLVFDLETTGLTPQDSPVGVNKTSRIGGRTLNQYAMEYPGVTADARLRPRIVALQLASGTRMAFDLDGLDRLAAETLFDDTIGNKTLIGHNLIFDLNWASHYTAAEPRRVLDTMLLVRCLRPSLPFMLHQRAAGHSQDAYDIVKSMQGFAGVSLEHTAVALGYDRPDKSYQKPVNWTLSILSPAHYEYVMSDVDLPLTVLKRLTGSDTVDEAMEAIDRRAPFYREIFEPAALALVGAHHRGMPLHLPAVAALKTKLIGVIAKEAGDLLAVAPELLPVADKVVGMTQSLTAAVKDAWAAHAAANGITLPRTATGQPQLDAKSAKLAGMHRLAAWSHWEKMQHAKKRLAMLGEYEDLSVPDSSTEGFGRLRPIISIGAATMRTTSQVPNVQNLPRDPEFRAIIRARPGYRILSIDYAQIELRIAAALAQRALQEAQEALLPGGKGNYKGYVVEGLLEATRGPIERECPPDPRILPDKERPAAWAAYYQWTIAVAYRRVLERGTPLAEVFRRNLDPHLLTAVGMAAKAGKVDLGGLTPVDFLASHEEPDALKALLKAERQSAKALNFGLLYGMSVDGRDGEGGLYNYGITSYGLTWSRDEARAAREDWFDLYVDVAFWQIWVRLTKKYTRDTAMYWDYYVKADGEKGARLAKGPLQTYLVHTLSGRPIVTSSLIEALNYQDQGSGADMMLGAMGNLPPEPADHFIDVIHDEGLFEVPEARVEEITSAVRATMLHWADRMLAPYGIPSDCEAAVAEVWQH